MTRKETQTWTIPKFKLVGDEIYIIFYNNFNLFILNHNHMCCGMNSWNEEKHQNKTVFNHSTSKHTTKVL